MCYVWWRKWQAFFLSFLFFPQRLRTYFQLSVIESILHIHQSLCVPLDVQEILSADNNLGPKVVLHF